MREASCFVVVNRFPLDEAKANRLASHDPAETDLAVAPTTFLQLSSKHWQPLTQVAKLMLMLPHRANFHFHAEEIACATN